MYSCWRLVEAVANWTRHWLSLVMVVHACQLHPAFVTAYFDQTSAEHDAKEEPAVCPDNNPGWWRAAGKLLPGHEGAEKNGQKASLQELRLPTKGIPLLANIHDGVVQSPQEEHCKSIGSTGHRHSQGQKESQGCDAIEERVGAHVFQEP
uniref:Putative secreted protein n=1 Tax=Ixodes ricinus TaxID=34613 RepID=A0A6B0UVK7_IXORI